MDFYVEQRPQGGWRVMMRGNQAPVSVHDTEEEARERVAAYIRGVIAAESPTAETGIPRGERVKLKDGSEVIIRPVVPDDKPLLAEAFERLGSQSRYQRFLGTKQRLSPDELAFLTEIDHADHEAFGALDPETGKAIGVARFVRERPGGPVAEAAVAVVDEWQGRGLGWALLEPLAERAREVGVETFSASLLTANRAMLALFARLGKMELRHDSGSTMRLRVSLDVSGWEELREALRAAARGDVG